MAKIKSKLFIFDFDGTIADTKSLYYKAIYNELKFCGYSYKEIDKAIDLGMNLKKTLRNLGFSFLVSWFLQKRIMKNVKKDIWKVKKCKDVDLIKNIPGYKILVSNSLKEFIIPIIKHLKLNCFKEIYGAEDFSDKAEFIKEYIKKKGIKKENCYYIGDRVADIKIAKKVGCVSIIISNKCAWDNRAEILKAGPDFIVNSFKDLRKITKN